MIDSFLRDHQPGIDHMHEENAINDLKNAGIYPDLNEIKLCFCDEAQNGDLEEGHYHCKKCDCILTQYEDDICCCCEEDYE